MKTTKNWESIAKSYAKKNRALSRQLKRDPLTGVGNRQLLNYLMERRGPKHLKTCALVAVVDLDNFKTINDSLGHAEGDRLLKKAARALKRCCRSIDQVIRQGGDEFAIVMRKIHPEDLALLKAQLKERLREASEGLPYGVGFSYGIAQGLGNELSNLMDAADKAMYRKKKLSKSYRSQMVVAA